MSNKTPLLNDNINQLSNELKTKCYKSTKCFNNLEGIMRSIDKATKTELREFRETFDSNVEEEAELYEEIQELTEKIRNFNGNKNAIGDIQTKSNDIFNKNEGVHQKVQQIKRQFDSLVPASIQQTQEEAEEEKRNSEGNGSFMADKLIVHNVQKNEEILRNRREVLNDAKLVSGHIQGIAQEMKLEIYHQGEGFNQIEDHVIEVQENVLKAEKDIKKADQVSKSSRNRTCWIIGIIAFVVAAAITLILVLTEPWNTKPSTT